MTPSGRNAPAQNTIGLTPSQLDMEWQPHLKQMFWTVQERRLTSLHSFLDANPFTQP